MITQSSRGRKRYSPSIARKPRKPRGPPRERLITDLEDAEARAVRWEKLHIAVEKRALELNRQVEHLRDQLQQVTEDFDGAKLRGRDYYEECLRLRGYAERVREVDANFVLVPKKEE